MDMRGHSSNSLPAGPAPQDALLGKCSLALDRPREACYGVIDSEQGEQDMDVVRLQIRVRPGARETRIIGWEEGVLQLSVHAPARDGQANRAVTELVAQTLGVPKSAVTLHRGARGRDKVLLVETMSAEELRRRLDALPIRGSE